jgi:Mitochondrial biogenesis AIM24
MEYKIVGDVMQALQITLQRNEEIYAEAGAMLYMGPGIDLQSKMQGGLMKGLMRKFLAGESLFMSVFRCETGSAHMALANPIAGKIIPIQLNGTTILAERTPTSAPSATSISRSHSPSASARDCSAVKGSCYKRSADRVSFPSTPVAT